MELLAPAGSKESFVAAIRGGADSVYVGVKSHNARIYAKNLSFYDLEVLIHHAHERGRKVYVTFNTLIKQREMDDAARALAALERLGPDALIVQDMGVARVVREHFPGLALHSSTQMAAHNGQGAAVLAERGFTRVIVARELSFSELKLIAGGSPVELEVFCHGALCFCVSGMCLFSSAMGGHSGNRGRCTQPCRRLWRSGKEKGYLFSPKDLQLAEHVRKLRSIGVAGLKIEGRLRSSDYVYRVVKAYRAILDADDGGLDEALKEARALLAADYARAKTTALFSGRDPDLISPGQTQCLGLRIGEVAGSVEGRLSIEVSRALERGDRLRVSDPGSDRTEVLKVKDFTRDGKRYELPYSGPAFGPGTPVFLAGDARSEEKSFTKEVDALFVAYGGSRGRAGDAPPHSKAYAGLLANQWARNRGAARSERLWITIDDPAWTRVIPLRKAAAGVDAPPDAHSLPDGARHRAPAGVDADLVMSLNRDNLHAFLDAAKDLPVAAKDVICQLTPYIGQRELPEFRRAVQVLSAAGFSRWILNNVSHFGFFKDTPAELIAGPFLYTWNAYAALAWKELGVSRFIVSWEDDALNIKELCRLALRGHLVAYLYGYPPLARSRMLSKRMCDGGPVEEKPGVRFRRVFESGSAILIPDKPVSLFNARKKLSELGIDAFGIDLSFIAPDAERWSAIYASFRDRVNPDDTIKFNFKRGVK
ncbi:MAG: peptidase U32 family protein [Elusimicrobiota bacterium]